MLRLQLFGVFELSDREGRPVEVRVKKERALLAYLALRDVGADRAHLSELLWPDRSKEQARKSLRQSFVNLRKVFGNAGAREAKVLPPDRVERPKLDTTFISVDVKIFEKLARENITPSLRQAADLYSGSFLPGLDFPDTPFQSWLDGERVRLNDLACDAMTHLTRQLLDQQDWDQAIEIARRLVAIDPIREMSHRLLMVALNKAGRRSEALRQFHRLSQLLLKELEVRPASDTLQLYYELKDIGPGRIYTDKDEMVKLVGNPGSTDAISSRPGLVVLPVRMEAVDQEDDALVEGLTEELIGSLAAYRWFFVISALQAMTYQGRSCSPRQLARELKVKYVLDSKLRRSGNRLKLRLVLSETVRSEHIWSDSISCFLDEIIEAQDQLVNQIARTVEPQLFSYEEKIAIRTPERDFDAWSLVVRSRRLADIGREDTLLEACLLARKAVSRNPDSAFCHAGLAWALWMTHTIIDSDDALVMEAINAASNAIEIDPRYYLGYMTMGGCQLSQGGHDGSISSLRRAIDLNPSFPVSYNQMISSLTNAGRPHDALNYIEPLDRISPNDPFQGYYRCVRALTYFFTGDDKAAIWNAELSLARHPVWLTSEAILIAANQRLGCKAETAQAVKSFLLNHDGITGQSLRDSFYFKYDRDFSTLNEQLYAAGALAT